MVCVLGITVAHTANTMNVEKVNNKETTACKDGQRLRGPASSQQPLRHFQWIKTEQKLLPTHVLTAQLHCRLGVQQSVCFVISYHHLAISRTFKAAPALPEC